MYLESQDGEKSQFNKEKISAPMESYITYISFLLMSPGKSLHEIIHTLAQFTSSLCRVKRLLCNIHGAGKLLISILVAITK